LSLVKPQRDPKVMNGADSLPTRKIHPRIIKRY
jgi:hypothetical protein